MILCSSSTNKLCRCFYLLSLAFFGVLFPKDQEPAFASFRFWQAIGYTVAFATSIPDFVCVSYKLNALLGSLTFGMGLYYLLEWQLRHDLADRKHDELYAATNMTNKAFEGCKGEVERTSK